MRSENQFVVIICLGLLSMIINIIFSGIIISQNNTIKQQQNKN
ncbi:hypothetical protein ABLO26_24810 [Neobacillus sp. 179-J 1A1 HS]